MSSSESSPRHAIVADGERFNTRALPRATAVALAGSIAGVLAIRLVLGAVSNAPSAFTPLKPASIVSLTVLGVLGAALFALLLNRIAAQPVWLYRRVVPIAVLVSLVPDLLIWSSSAYAGTAHASTVLPLMAMHLVVAGTCLLAIPRFATRPGH